MGSMALYILLAVFPSNMVWLDDFSEININFNYFYIKGTHNKRDSLLSTQNITGIPVSLSTSGIRIHHCARRINFLSLILIYDV